MDNTDKDSMQYTKSLVLFSPQLQHESVQDSLDYPIEQYITHTAVVCQRIMGSQFWVQ